MSKRIFLSLTVVAAVVAPAFAACGGSTNNGGSPEGGTQEASTTDGGKHPESGAMDTGAGETGDDGGIVPPPTGMQLVKSTTIYVAGVTSDGLVLYVDTVNQGGVLYSIPVAGGSPTMIANVGQSNSVNVTGTAALIWENIGTMSGVGTFAVWTAAHGIQSLGMASMSPGNGAPLAAVSNDGKYVIYNDGVDSMQTTTSFYMAGTDGTGKTAALVTGARLDVSNCAPSLGFGGDNGVAAYCTMAPVDGGAPDAGDGGTNNDIGTIASFTGATFTMATLASNVFPGFLADDQGTHVLVASVAGGLQAYPIAGGSPVSVDAAGSLGFITKDGMNTIYTTTAPALKRSPIGAPNPTTLVASGVTGLLAISVDQSLVLGYKGFDPNSGLTDLTIASATTMGSATQLVTTMDTQLYGDPFTADNSHVLFFNMLDQNGNGTLNSVPAAGGMPAAVGQTVYNSFSATGSKILFNDNWTNGINGGNQGNGEADLEALDTAMTSAKPKTLAGQADALFYLTAAKDKVVYSWSYDNTSPLAGLYVIPVP
jgi:hypothetical protein